MTVKNVIIAMIITAGLGLSGCKSKPKQNTGTTNNAQVDTNRTVGQAPVEIAQDTELQRGVQDAVKDHPGVTATVDNGVINVSGTIEKSKWIQLNQTLNSLNPKSVKSDNLTVK